MKLDLGLLSRQLLAIIVGAGAVAFIFATISVIGYFLGPYFQWLPSVVDARLATSVNSYVLLVWIGLQILLFCSMVVISAALTLLALDRVRDFGNHLLSFVLPRAAS